MKADWEMSGGGGGRHVSLTVTSGHSHRTFSPRLQICLEARSILLALALLSHVTLAQPSPFPLPRSRTFTSQLGSRPTCEMWDDLRLATSGLLAAAPTTVSGRQDVPELCGRLLCRREHERLQFVQTTTRREASVDSGFACSGKAGLCFSNLCRAQCRSCSDCQFSSESQSKADGERERR